MVCRGGKDQTIQTENRKKDMIAPLSVSWLNATNDMIDNLLFSGYKFGDEIKDYYMEFIDEENMTFSVIGSIPICCRLS